MELKGLTRKLTKKQYIVAGIIAIIVTIFAFVAARNGNGDKEIITVVRRDVVEEVVVSGRVEAGTVADLGLEVSGKVRYVSVIEGDVVSEGAILVSLDIGTFSAELAQAQADVLIKEAEIVNAQSNLDDVTQQQDTLVESAYRTLLSDDLEVEPSSNEVTATAPTINGRYVGLEGRYKIRILNRSGSFSNYDVITFGIESTKRMEISKTTATPLGTYGLFISFPDDVSNYSDTIWYVDIPNLDGPSYTKNLNAYEEAIRNRDVVVETARAKVISGESGVSISEAELARAHADVSRIQAEIAKRRILAPFSGLVTQVAVVKGEIVTAGESVVSVISEGLFGIEIDLPEVDSVKVKTGDVAAITLDAFSKTDVFDAVVASVNRTESIVDGVPVYEARLAFTQEDDRVRSGMTADVTITTEIRENVLAIPARSVKFREDGTTYVFVGDGRNIQEVSVVTGLRGSDGYFEILSGLSEGDTVVVQK